MRRAIWATALVVFAAACAGKAEPPGTTSSPPPGAAIDPAGLPDGTPPSYEEDVGSPDVPPEALVPAGASVTNVWYAEPSVGSSILVGFSEPGTTDALMVGRGLIVWRRSPGAPHPWRPVLGLVDPPRRGVVQIQAIIGDATGDGSPDALTFENVGGSGVCGTWRVLDLAANAEVLTKRTCDTTIDLSADPVGLVVREALFASGDAHCCPSAMRTSILSYDGSGWKVASSIESPA